MSLSKNFGFEKQRDCVHSDLANPGGKRFQGNFFLLVIYCDGN